MDEEGVLDFLTSLEAMDLPDRIEEVNAKILSKIIEDTDYVAVLFCKYLVLQKINLYIFKSLQNITPPVNIVPASKAQMKLRHRLNALN